MGTLKESGTCVLNVNGGIAVAGRGGQLWNHPGERRTRRRISLD